MIVIKKFIKEPLVRGAFVALVGTVLVGFGNYLFQVLMGRMLTPSEFGSLAALLSLSIILTVPNQAISLTTTQFVAKLYANKKLENLPRYARNLALKILPYGLVLSFLMLLLSKTIENFLNLPEICPIYILSLCFLFSFLSPLELGIYRGIQNFFQSAVAQFVSVVAKILMALLFVSIGLGVMGALWAYFISIIVLIIYVTINLKLYQGISRSEFKTRPAVKISSSAWITLLVSFCLVALYNLDVILVKHFLPATEAGFYAIISLAGKIIIFFTGSISNVMFPLAASNHESNKSNKRIILMSVSFIVLVSLAIILLYAVVPEFIVSLLFGQKYLEISTLLWLGGIIFALYSVINFLSLYFLSVQKTKFSVILAVGTMMEVVLICFFHNSLLDILYSILSSMVFMVTALTVYYFITSTNLPFKYEESLDNSTNL